MRIPLWESRALIKQSFLYVHLGEEPLTAGERVNIPFLIIVRRDWGDYLDRSANFILVMLKMLLITYICLR